MTKLGFLSIILLVCVFPASAQIKDAYIPGVPPPPPSLDRDRGKTATGEAKVPQHHIDLMKLQQEADDLACTAQTAGVRQGTLPKDMIEKLRRIEKLSKRLRSELNP
ncbi:MAG: hypothetical protein DMG79_11815 [Acidobacteria bacterium]|nr:MAG: hypothetical protein DMG79_11815 [Acidobacteriota bacterium]